jgi:hypothetical protein
MILALMVAALAGMALGVALAWLACVVTGLWLGWHLLTLRTY